VEDLFEVNLDLQDNLEALDTGPATNRSTDIITTLPRANAEAASVTAGATKAALIAHGQNPPNITRIVTHTDPNRQVTWSQQKAGNTRESNTETEPDPKFKRLCRTQAGENACRKQKPKYPENQTEEDCVMEVEDIPDDRDDIKVTATPENRVPAVLLQQLKEITKLAAAATSQ
jgi:hypothetical protein